MAKISIILNPAAGAVKDVNALVAKLRALPNAEVYVTAKPGGAIPATRKAIHNGCEIVVAAGGDGTLNEVVNGLRRDDKAVALGLIPLGTGNDFARTLALPLEPDEAIELLAAGHTRAIDLIRVTSDQVRYFLNVSTGGFSGVVDEKLTLEMKKTWGPLAYLRGAAAALPELRAYQATVSFDNENSLALRLYNVVIANGRYVASGTQIAPEAAIDDGLLDIVLIPECSPGELAVIAARLALGSHLSSSAVVFRRAARVVVRSRPPMSFNVDGELVGGEPAQFDVLPRALQFIVPPP
jgi:diacylglycerol kinase (ATP)